MDKRQSADVLTETLDLDGKRVVDVGCGDGAFSRLMTRHGAKVIGIEPNPEQLEKAMQADPAGGETYGQAQAEDLPMKGASKDIVVLVNSLHHVDVDKQRDALKEAARVLKDRGLVYICEPLAEGSHFQLMQPVHDETVVRAKAYEVIQGAAELGLAPVSEQTFSHTARYADFDAFRGRITTINPRCVGTFDKLDAQLRQAFEALGVKGDEGWEFDQPMRVNLLRK